MSLLVMSPVLSVIGILIISKVITSIVVVLKQLRLRLINCLCSTLSFSSCIRKDCLQNKSKFSTEDQFTERMNITTYNEI